jgi:flavin-dependent dehydrogenase
LKVAIAGAGTTGAYLYRLLKNEGFQADIFDKKRSTACGITPCAWGTSIGFVELVQAAGLDPEKYILQRVDHVFMDEVQLKGKLMTYNKPSLEKDLLKGATIKSGPLRVRAYDRVIDATGTRRAYLPPIQKDILLPCSQRRVTTEAPLENRIKLGGLGYAWCFPLGRHGYHVGCGTLARNPSDGLKEIGWLTDNPKWKILCTCKGKVRLSGPHGSQPFVCDVMREGIWGVGESIGCVAPLAGDGVVPGMKSVKILLDHWDDPDGYTAAILKEFEWMKKEREVVNKLKFASRLKLKDAWVLKKNATRMGIDVALRDAMVLLKAIR